MSSIILWGWDSTNRDYTRLLCDDFIFTEAEP